MGFYKNINLINFRNFDNLSLEFTQNCNVFYGKNGSGKTNLLEAISLFSKGRGFRKDKISNMIKTQTKKFIISSNFQNNEIIYNFRNESQKINDNIKKIFTVNCDKTKETHENIYPLTPFLFFSPETERLFISSPLNRRNFIDQLIFTYTKGYNKIINEYNKFIKERSKILLNNTSDEIWLYELEKKISELGLKIYLLRNKQLEVLIENLNFYLNTYKLPFKINAEINDKFYRKELNQEYFEQKLKKNRLIDSQIGGSKIGPHKTDYVFFVNDDFYISQLSTGQQKTIILLLFLSHCKFLVKNKEKSPIILLDEVCSHLDEINRHILLNLIESFNLQIFMTGTNKNLFSFLSTNTNFCNITN